MWQAEHVAERLRAEHASLTVELVPMSTRGDKLLDAPLAKVGGKGLFVKELEVALLEQRADLAVHSMKDVPVELPEGLHLPVILARADARDALVSTRHARLADLPRGARVGTSSLRRKCQIRASRPDVELLDLRGSVQTRLGRLDDGYLDAIILACAGLERLGLGARVREPLDPEIMLPAIGQGALGIECRRGDAEVESLVAPLHDERTAACVLAERAMNARLGGGCQVPIGGHAVLEGDSLWLRGLVASPDGGQVLRGEARRPRAEGEALGAGIAEELLGRGAGDILAEVYARGGE